MHADKVPDAVGFRVALTIVLGQLDASAVGSGHHGHKAVDLAVGEMQVGPLERFYRNGSITDCNAIASPRLGQAALVQPDSFSATVRSREGAAAL